MTDNDPQSPARNLRPRTPDHGIKSLILLAITGSAAVVVGILLALRPPQPPPLAETPAAPAPLATRLVSALDLTEPTGTLIRHAGKLERNETLTGLVKRLGVSPGEAEAALRSVYADELIDHRRLQPGLEAHTYLQDGRLTALSLKTAPGTSVLVTRGMEGGWHATQLNPKLQPAYRYIAAEIDGSIYATALQLGAQDQQVVDFAAAFAYDIDFQREIHPGDRFEIVYETLVDERGNPVRNGQVLYAGLEGKALVRGFYRFTPEDDGVSDYFDQSGQSATRFLMKTPINGARISSGFGTRRHPISGFTRLHKGTDFAAPTGTPIYAAGHGRIQKAGWNGGYGHYVRIRHANGYETAYAHLSRYARGLKAGQRVRQGDVIGYVGSTGASTGPHLHYEVWVNDRPVNVMSLKLPTGRKLSDTPAILASFMAEKARIDALRGQQPSAMMASASVPEGTAGP